MKFKDAYSYRQEIESFDNIVEKEIKRSYSSGELEQIKEEISSLQSFVLILTKELSDGAKERLVTELCRGRYEKI